MKNYPKIAQKLLREEIRDVSDPVIAPRITNKIDEIINLFRKNNIEYDEYIIGYVADLSELGYMMQQIITEPIDLNIDTILYNYVLSLSGYNEKGKYPYCDKKINDYNESNDLISVRQTDFDIIYIFDKTDFVGAKINGITVT